MTSPARTNSKPSSTRPTPNSTPKHPYRLTLPALIGLAALTVPRVILHDLHLTPLDAPLYKLLAVGPFLVWIIVILLRRTGRPFYDFLLLGLIYGLMLAVTHQLTWTASWSANPPAIGGNLVGRFDPVVESLILRTAALMSSLMTGLATGAVFGLIAAAVTKLWPRRA